MDVYAELLMKNGAALVTLAKGNRSRQWTDSCKKFGGFYLGTPGGIAALIASKYILSQEIIDYEELGMEAVRLVEVRDLPCFVVTDDSGEDFYENIKNKR
jgi:fumarate hydratase class I